MNFKDLFFPTNHLFGRHISPAQRLFNIMSIQTENGLWTICRSALSVGARTVEWLSQPADDGAMKSLSMRSKFLAKDVYEIIVLTRTRSLGSRNTVDPAYIPNQPLVEVDGLDVGFDTNVFQYLATGYLMGGKPFEELCEANAEVSS
jgi:hypothetical protein